MTLSAAGLPENAAAATALLAQGRPALVWRRIIADSDTPVGAARRLIVPGRGDFLLASKMGIVVRDDGKRGIDCSASAIKRFIDESLARLKTDRIDLYITHWQDPTTPVAETVEVLKALQAEGKILAFAASNTSPADVAAYQAAEFNDALASFARCARPPRPPPARRWT